MLVCGNTIVTLRHWVVKKSHATARPFGEQPIVGGNVEDPIRLAVGAAVGAMVGLVGEAVVVKAIQFRTIAPAVKVILHGLFRKAFESI
jgi:hypothetical protein